MAHDHSHHHPTTYNKAFFLAVALNLGFTIIEAIYAVIANSMSLLADAGHNLGDVLGLVLAWGANYLLSKPASERYSYGYKRTTILAAIMNAFLLVATSAIIAYESIWKFFNPSEVTEIIVIIVAAIGILINGGTALLFISGTKEDLNIKGAFLHLATDALISVGVVIVGIAIYYTDWEWLDPCVGLAIVVIILIGTWGLLRDSVNLLLDAVPYHINHKAIREYLLSLPGVTDLHDLHIWGLSTKEVALTVHLIMPEARLSDADFLQITKDLHNKFKIDHPTLQVETGCDDHPCHLQSTCDP